MMHALIEAIRKLDYGKVKTLLEGGASPDTCTKNGIPALCLAIDVEADAFAQEGVTDRYSPEGDKLPPSGRLVQLLLNAGANPNVLDFKDLSPLDVTLGGTCGGKLVMYHPAAVELLVEAGGKPNKYSISI